MRFKSETRKVRKNSCARCFNSRVPVVTWVALSKHQSRLFTESPSCRAMRWRARTFNASWRS